MSQRNASLSHHFHEISKAVLEPKIPSDAKDDDFPVEMAALEKVIHVQRPGSRPQKQVCGEYAPLPPFAPEPLITQLALTSSIRATSCLAIQAGLLPARRMNHDSPRLGIPSRFSLFGTRSNAYSVTQ
jgi:hypothetical protein